MNQCSEKECSLYKNFVDAVCRWEARVWKGDWDRDLSDYSEYHQLADAWYDLYNINNSLALKALFYLYSRECPFHNVYLFYELLDHFSEIEPAKCISVINSGVIEKYAGISGLLSLVGCEEDDIDLYVIDRLARLMGREISKNKKSGNSKLFDIKYQISCNGDAIRYFEKYYGVKPEFWADLPKVNKEDNEKSKYDLSPLNEYDID